MKKFIYLLIVLFCCACEGKKSQTADNDTKPVIAVTIEPQRYFTEAIAGDKYNVVSIVPKGMSPETYDPTPQQMVSLAGSKAFLRIGHIGFEKVWMDRLLDNTPHIQVFDISEDVNLIYEDHDHDHDIHTHSCGNGVEPHIWNSPENALVMARNTYKALTQLDKENENYYLHRYDSLCNVILKTDSVICELLSSPERTNAFMIYHPALSYFARDYGLLQVSIEQGGKEPTPAHLKGLVDFCKNNRVNIIFVQPEFDTRNAEIVAKETGARIVRINPLNYNWAEEMIAIAQALSGKEEKK